MIFALGVICGVLGCVALSVIMSLCSPKDGYLRIDRSDNEPYLFLEIKKPVEDLSRKSTVTFDVKNENFVSRD